MLKVLSEYERFYKTKHNGRAITWHHEQGFAVVNAWFPKRDGPYNLHVSLFQAVVLELFNEAESLTFREILDQTKLGKLSPTFKSDEPLLKMQCREGRTQARTQQSLRKAAPHPRQASNKRR